MIDMIEFIYDKNGMEKGYQKILDRELWILDANGRTKESLSIRYKELTNRQERLFEEIQHEMLEITLTKRALKEISSNWNNKKYKYWGEDE